MSGFDGSDVLGLLGYGMLVAGLYLALGARAAGWALVAGGGAIWILYVVRETRGLRLPRVGEALKRALVRARLVRADVREED